MSTQSDRVAVVCPSCSPTLETVHEVLKPGNGQITVRCTDCGHVHKTTVESESTVEKMVVISQDGESVKATVSAPPKETSAVGEEFIVDTEEAILTVRITSIETTDGNRVEEATIEDIKTFWTRAVDNISVNVTMHPKDGRRDETKSLKIQVPGDYDFTVGRTEELDGEEFTVEGIILRDDAEGYDREQFDFGGDSAKAKDIKRLYVRDESSTAWSAW
ncbi:HVO_0476 family zinc finger protein [Haladaptatus sp. GCM10025707]|uniref:HVO_0476 family zinc finger protein n=1 Tax=unclassified Haladaptatus TaxID=2622732 RepID=UPI0023E7C13B|nr:MULTISPECIES: HVO_0476 family zinc finger protein [unclassified Haladaptatus]